MPRPNFYSRLAGCAALAGMMLVGGHAQAEQTIRVAYLRTFGMMPYFYAQESGAFKREGIKVENIPVNNGADVVAAVVSGSADVGYAAMVPAILAHGAGQPIKAFFSINFEQYPAPTFTALVATAKSGITSIAGLKGHTVAVNAITSACALILGTNLAKAGMSVHDIKRIIIPFPNMPAALQLGQADAACVVDPFFTKIMKSPQIKAHVLAEGQLADLKKFGHVVLDGYFADASWLPKNVAAEKKFMLAVMGAAKKLEANPKLYRETLEHEFKLPPALIKAMPIALHTVNFEALPADYQPLIDGLAQVGALAKSFPASQMVFQVKP